MKNFDLRTTIAIAAAAIELDRQLTPDEQMNEIFYDGDELFYSERVEAILDEHNIDHELFMHYCYDNSDEYEQLRIKVDEIKAAYEDLSTI